MILGGIIVVKKGNGGVQYWRREEDFGEYPRDEEVLQAAAALAA